MYLRCSAVVAAALLLAVVTPTGVTGQDLVGTWVLSVDLDVGSGDATFVFEVDGNQITGMYSGAMGDHMITGTIEVSTVRFGFSADDVGDVTYEGTIDGDSMAGDCEYGDLGSGTFSGSKSG